MDITAIVRLLRTYYHNVLHSCIWLDVFYVVCLLAGTRYCIVINGLVCSGYVRLKSDIHVFWSVMNDGGGVVSNNE